MDNVCKVVNQTWSIVDFTLEDGLRSSPPRMSESVLATQGEAIVIIIARDSKEEVSGSQILYFVVQVYTSK